MANYIVGSKIGGILKNLIFDDSSSNLKYKSGATEITVSNGGEVTNVSILQMVRPVSDDALFPIVEACANSNFLSGETTTYNSKSNTNGERSKFMAYSSGWNTFPETGLGTPFDNSVVICDMSQILYNTPYYVRWRWVSSEDVYTDWQSSMFPTSVGFVPSSSTAN